MRPTPDFSSEDKARFPTHIVGKRKPGRISLFPSAELLAEGARLNDEIHRLTVDALVPKGVYRFKSHEEANQFDLECQIERVARIAQDRSR